MSHHEAWTGLSRQELDHQLSPSRSARNVSATFGRWQAESEKARGHPEVTAHLNLAYGTAAGQKLDLYTCREETSTSLRPLHVFIHGGFWQEGSKDISAFPAPAFVAEGWIFVALGYTLAPDATLTDIAREVRQALAFLHRNVRDFGADPDRIVVSGHSAGGHLAASLLTVQADEAIVPPLLGVVPISGVFDLAPIRASYVNDAVQMSDEEVAGLSPALSRPIRDIPVALAVGCRETAEFIRQTQLLAAAWGPALTRLSVETIPDCDHFDILLELCDPSSRLFRLVTAMLGDDNRKMPS